MKLTLILLIVSWAFPSSGYWYWCGLVSTKSDPDKDCMVVLQAVTVDGELEEECCTNMATVRLTSTVELQMVDKWCSLELLATRCSGCAGITSNMSCSIDVAATGAEDAPGMETMSPAGMSPTMIALAAVGSVVGAMVPTIAILIWKKDAISRLCCNRQRSSADPLVIPHL